MSSTNKRRRALAVTQEKNIEPSSKRRSKGGKKATQEPPKRNISSNLFTTSLQEVGFKFGFKGNQIGCESHTFRQKLTKFLTVRDILLDSREDFIAAIDETFKDEVLFVASLFPSELESEDEMDFSSPSCDILQV